jgi:hypothetical protein
MATLSKSGALVKTRLCGETPVAALSSEVNRVALTRSVAWMQMSRRQTDAPGADSSEVSVALVDSGVMPRKDRRLIVRRHGQRWSMAPRSAIFFLRDMLRYSRSLNSPAAADALGDRLLR